MHADGGYSTTDSDAEVDVLVGATYREQLHRFWDQQDELLRHASVQRWGRERPPTGTSRSLRWPNPDEMDAAEEGRE